MWLLALHFICQIYTAADLWWCSSFQTVLKIWISQMRSVLRLDIDHCWKQGFAQICQTKTGFYLDMLTDMFSGLLLQSQRVSCTHAIVKIHSRQYDSSTSDQGLKLLHQQVHFSFWPRHLSWGATRSWFNAMAPHLRCRQIRIHHSWSVLGSWTVPLYYQCLWTDGETIKWTQSSLGCSAYGYVACYIVVKAKVVFWFFFS